MLLPEVADDRFFVIAFLRMTLVGRLESIEMCLYSY